MIFEELALIDAYLIVPERHEDERGSFMRSYCRDRFLDMELKDCSLQSSISVNHKKATLRGMHFQASPHGETKLIRCTKGAIFDVIVDVRPNSKSFKNWVGTELSRDNALALYVPQGFAHGFVSLADESDVAYQMAEPFVAEAASGFRWDDPDIGIQWPVAPEIISAKDKDLPEFKDLKLKPANANRSS